MKAVKVSFRIKKNYKNKNGEKTEGSIAFGPRKVGEIGLDILAVKIALGVVVPNVKTNTTKENKISLEKNVWFDCDSEVEIDQEKSSTFDKKTQIRLMEFQLQNREEILRYMLAHVHYSFPEEGQILAEDILFESEFGRLGDATLYALHGWRAQGDIFDDRAFIFEPGINSKEVLIPRTSNAEEIQEILEESVSTIPEPNDGTGSWSDQWDRISYVGPTRGTFKERMKNEFGYTFTGAPSWDDTKGIWSNEPAPPTPPKPEVEGKLAPRSELESKTINKREDSYTSPLSAATVTALEKSAQSGKETRQIISKSAEEQSIATAFHPDPFTSSVPYVITNRMQGYFYNTEYTLNNPPPLSGDLETQAIKEITTKALKEFIDYYGLPHIWIIDESKLLEFRRLFPNSKTKSPSHNGSLTDTKNWCIVFADKEYLKDQAIIDLDSVESYLSLEDDKEAIVVPMIRFVEYITPTFRPRDTYRAKFEIYMPKLEFFSTCQGYKISTIDEISKRKNFKKEVEDNKSNSAETSVVCEETEDPKEITRQIEEYKMFVSKRKKEVSRRMREYSANREYREKRQRGATAFLGDNFDMDIDADVNLSQNRNQSSFGVDGSYHDETVYDDNGFEYGENVYPHGDDDVNLSEDGLTLTYDNKILVSTVKQAAANLKAAEKDVAGLKYPSKYSSRKLSINPKREGALLDSLLLSIDKILQESEDFQAFASSQGISNPYLDYEELTQRTTKYGIINTPFDSNYMFTFKFEKESKSISVKKNANDFEGYVLKSISFGTATITAESKSTSGNDLKRFFRASPLNRPRTVAYFAQSGKIQSGEGVSGTGIPMLQGKSCFLLGINHVKLIQKYTAPFNLRPPEGDPNTKSAATELWNEVKKSTEEWYETSINNITNPQPTYNINDLLPAFGPNCSLEELWDKFLAKFDLLSLICEWVKCIKLPQINISLDFDFRLPPIPKLPTIDFMNFLRMMLIEFLVEMLIRMLCTMANAILDLLKFPDCEDLFADNFGKYDFGTLADQFADPSRFKDNPFGGQAALGVRALSQAMTDTGVPKEKLEDMKSVIDDIFSILTPREVCLLFKGEASQRVLSAVQNLLRLSGADQDLVDHFSDEEKLLYFFESVGVFFDPQLCEKLEELDKITGEITCKERFDAIEQLREELSKNSDIDEDEIERLLDLAKSNLKNRANKLQDIMSGQPLSKAIPSLFAPGDETAVVSSLPNSFKNSLDTVSKGIFDTAKMTYTTDLGAFVPSLYNNVNQLAQPGDPEYDEASRLFLDESVERMRLFNEAMEAKELNERPAFFANRGNSEQTPERYSIFTLRENLYKPFVKRYYNEDKTSSKYKTTVSEEEYHALDDKNQEEYVAFYPKEYSVETDQDTGQLSIVTKLTPKYPLSTPDIVGRATFPSAFGIFALSAPAANLDKLSLFGPSFELPKIKTSKDGGTVDVVISKYSQIKHLIKPGNDGGFKLLTEEDNAVNLQLKGMFMKDIQDRLLDLSETIRVNADRAIKVTSRNKLLPEIRPFFDISLETMKNKWETSNQTGEGYQDVSEIYESGTEDNSRPAAGGNVFHNFFEGVDSYLSDGRPAISLKFQPTNFIDRIDSSGSRSASIVTLPIPAPPAIKLIEENSPSNEHYRYSIQVIDPYMVGKNIRAYDDPKIVKYSYCKLVPDEFKQYVPETLEYARRDTYASLFTKVIKNDLDRYNVSYSSTDAGILQGYGKQQVYRSLLESVFEFLVTSLYESNIFDAAYVNDLEKRIAGKKHFDLKSQCVSNVSGLESGSILSFNDLIKDFVSEVEKEFAKPENKPEFTDYSKPGPIEKAFQNVIVKAMIRIFYVEFMLRGAIMNSMFNPCFVSNNKFFDDYMFDFVKSQFDNKDFFSKSSAKEDFMKSLIRTAEMDPDNLNLADAALKSLLVQGKNKFLSDSIKLYQTDRQDYIADFTNRIPSRDVKPFRLQWIDDEFGTVQNPPVNYHPKYKFDIWTQDIPKDYRINGGFLLEYYIRMKKKSPGESLTDFTANPSEIIRRNLSSRIDEAQADPNNPLLRGDNFDSDEVLDLDSEALGSYLNEITLPTTRDSFRNKELVSIEELGLLYQNHLDSYFDENFTDALREEFEEGLDIFSTNAGCSVDGSNLARKPKIIKKLPVRLIKRDRAHFRITNTLNSEIILRDAKDVLLDSLVYDSTQEGDTRYYAIPGNYCQASTQFNKFATAAIEITNSETTNDPILRPYNARPVAALSYENYFTTQAILGVASDIAVGGRRSYKDHFGGYKIKYLDTGFPNLTNHLVENLEETVEMGNLEDDYKKRYYVNDITEDDISISVDPVITANGIGNTSRGIQKGHVAFPNNWFHANQDQTNSTFSYWHPFDPAAPWNILNLDETLEDIYTTKLGTLTKQEFSDYLEVYNHSTFSAAQRTATGPDASEDVMVENWVEIVVDLFDDAAVPLYTPGESFHFREELPVLSHQQLNEIDKYIPFKNVSLTNTPMFWTFRNFNDMSNNDKGNRDDARVNGYHDSPENRGYSLGNHYRNTYGVFGATFVFVEKDRANMPHPSSERNNEQLDFVPGGEWYNWRTNGASTANYTKSNHGYGNAYRKPKYWSHFRLSRPLGYSPVAAPGGTIRHELGRPVYDASRGPIGEQRSMVQYDPVTPSSPAIKIYETNKYYVPIRLLITQISSGFTQTEVETYVKVIIPKVMQARKETETSVNTYRKGKLQEALNSIYGEYLTFLKDVFDMLKTNMAFSVQMQSGPIDAEPNALVDYRDYTFIRDLPSFAKSAHRNSFISHRGYYSYRENSSTPYRWNDRTQNPIRREEYEKRVSEHVGFCSVEKVYSIAANMEAKLGHENFGMSQDFLDDQFLQNPGILTKDYNIEPHLRNENYKNKFLEDQDYLSSTTEISRICRFIDFTGVRPQDGVFPTVANRSSFRAMIQNGVATLTADTQAKTFCQSIYNIAAVWYGQRRYDGFWGDTSYKPWLRGEVSNQRVTFVGRIEGSLRRIGWLKQQEIDNYAPNSHIYQSIFEIPDGPLLGVSPFVSDGRWSISEQMVMEKTSEGQDKLGGLGVQLTRNYDDGTTHEFYTKHSEIPDFEERKSSSIVYLAEDRTIRLGGVHYKVPVTLLPLYNYIKSVTGKTPYPYEDKESSATFERLKDSSVWYSDPVDMFWTMMAHFYLYGAGRIDQNIDASGALGNASRPFDEWKEYAGHTVNTEMFPNGPIYAEHNRPDTNSSEHKLYTLAVADTYSTDTSTLYDYGKYLYNGGRLLRNYRSFNREPIAEENLNNLSATLKFFVFPRTSLVQLMYLSRMRLFGHYITELYWSKISPVIDEIVRSTRSAVVSDVLNEINTAYLNTEIKFGVRLIQVLRGNLASGFVNNFNRMGNGESALQALTEEERTYLVINENELREKIPQFSPLEGDYPEDDAIDKTRSIWASEYEQVRTSDDSYTRQISSQTANLAPPMVCLPLITHEKVIDPECISWDILEQKYRNPDLRETLKKELLSKGEYKSLFNFIYPLNEFATMVNIFSLMILSSRQEMQEILDPTKSTLMTIFETMTNRNDFGKKTSAFDHLGATDLVNSELFKQFLDNATSEGPNMKCIELPSLGNFLKALVEQILNIIKYTPSIILRGIASAIDPAYMEMKQKHFSCGQEFVKSLSWSAIAYKSEKKHKKLLDGSTGCKEGKYVPVMPAFPIDLGYGIVTLDFSSMKRSLKKFTTYIYKADLPFFNFDFQFDIPCLMDEPFKKKADGFDIASNGRYGHPITPITVLALSTPELPTEKNPSGCALSCPDEGVSPPLTPPGRQVREATEGCADDMLRENGEAPDSDNNPC